MIAISHHLEFYLPPIIIINITIVPLCVAPALFIINIIS